MTTAPSPRPATLAQLRDSGWQSKTVKQELLANFTRMLAADDSLYPGIVGYEDTVIPEINIAVRYKRLDSCLPSTHSRLFSRVNSSSSSVPRSFS